MFDYMEQIQILVTPSVVETYKSFVTAWSLRVLLFIKLQHVIQNEKNSLLDPRETN